MKKTLLLFTLLTVLIGCEISTKNQFDLQVLNKLEELKEKQDYFRLKNVYTKHQCKLPEEYLLYYKAIINNAFNKSDSSNIAIAELLDKSEISLEDSLLNELYYIKLSNHINLFEYKQADQVCTYIKKNFSTLMDSSEIKALSNVQKIWKALKEVPKQEVVRHKDNTIPMIEDGLGLLNINVTFADTTVDLVFDTGANLSVIQRSYAEKLGMKFIDVDFLVNAATGVKVKSDLAIADKISIGGLSFTNVVFIVFDDEDLSFPQAGEDIEGIIGFPVIKAMEEIHITKNNNLYVPKNPKKYLYSNFALDGLMPIVSVIYNNDSLMFHFDTGANETELFALFYDKYKDSIEANYSKEVFHSSSVGGEFEFEGFIIDEIYLQIADKKGKLIDLQLYTNSLLNNEKHFHGNLGRDYIKQFDELIISFKYSSIMFK